MKRRIRNAAPTRRQHVIEAYQSVKTTYNHKAEEAQTKSWKDFCSAQEKESMWDGIYRVLRKTTRRQEDILLRNTSGETLSPEHSAALLAKTFYPDDNTNTDTHYHTQLRAQVEESQSVTTHSHTTNDPPFTETELYKVLSALNPKKAPGPDGLTSDICTQAILSDKELFMAMANQCLSLEYFPAQWKEAHVVILRKPGKSDYTHPKSYRPIGLLSILGKIIEKMMVGRIQWHIFPTLNKNQYGFMPQRGTEDALYNLVSHIKEEIETNKKIVLLISLDIEGAFDNAWWPALKHQLAKKKCPTNLYNMVVSYLQNRKITVNYARATYEKGTTKGCVQGSIGGPTFWNVILDSLLHELSGEEVYCQAFADDVVLVFSSHSTTTLEETANKTLQTVVEWGSQNKLNFAAHKTSAMIMTKKLKYGSPDIHMSGTKISLVEEIKLLGLTINRSLTFTSHVAAVCKKAADIYKQLACAAKVTWGLNSEIIRTIYVAVIEPIIMYASSAWAPATELNTVKETLNSLQRGFALKICKAYRTVSLTSALALTGLLPLDIRIQEAATLYLTKKGLSQDYLPPGKELEQRVSYQLQPHPSKLISTEFQLLEDMNPETIETHHIVGPQIYTDGSKIEGKTGAALTWWENGRETKSSTFSLDNFCTVFQAELYALYRAVDMANHSQEPEINILSDSRSSLELLKNPAYTIALTKDIKESINNIRAEGRELKLFWLRAHAGTEGNERADELAKQAALTPKPSPDYDKVPLSYIKRKIREESVLRWQDRYETSTTGAVTKKFLPNVISLYKTVRETKLTPLQVQALTGHGGIAEYLHRFHLTNSPECECDNNTTESVWHILIHCPRFSSARWDLEQQIDTNITEDNIQNLMATRKTREPLLKFMEKTFKVAIKRHSSKNQNQTHQQPVTVTTNSQALPTQQGPPQPPLQRVIHQPSLTTWMEGGERGAPGIRTRSVVLFMNTNYERLGIGFCYAGGNNKRVSISSGVALLIKRSTTRTSMKRKTYNALSEVEIAGIKSRLVRTRNKTVILLDRTANNTQFAQACTLLKKLAEASDSQTTPRIISVDTMTVDFDRGEIADYIGCIKASEHHEVVVYENRNQNLSFLRPQTPPPSAIQTVLVTQPISQETPLSGSEKLQERMRQPNTNTSPTPKISKYSSLLNAIGKATQWAPKTLGKRMLNRELTQQTAPTTSSGKQATAVEEFLRKKPKGKASKTTSVRTRAEMGLVQAPRYRQVNKPTDHMINAYTEYIAILQATKTILIHNCNKILEAFKHQNAGLLKVRLEEAEATIFNNVTSEIQHGEKIPQHKAAYNATAGIVPLDQEETQRSGKPKYQTPPNDPIVVTTKDTEIWITDQILERAKTLSEKDPPEQWEVPNIKWINGVPGCGKTTTIIANFDTSQDLVATTTIEAKNELRERISQRAGADAAKRVRTIASLLANGTRDEDKCSRLIVDEALLNHFGSIIIITRLTKAKELLLIGDINQVPYIDRDNLFKSKYHRPTQLVSISQQLLCTHRCPMDVAYATKDIYGGPYSSSGVIKSLNISSYKGNDIPKTQPKTLYLTNTQAEKAELKSKGFGKGEGSKVLTIHEAQGLTYESVIIIKSTTKKLQIHESVPHAVVAISRHTKSCVYYTDDSDDAIGRLIQRVTTSTPKDITDYNLKTAIHNRDQKVMEKMTEEPQQLHQN